jgi:AraC-like DNA-binding protein
MIINVKNMMCLRCKIVVKNILVNLGVEAESISLGEIVLKKKLPNHKLKQLQTALKETELELIFDQKNIIDQKIKSLITEIVHYSNEPLRIKFSCYLSSRLNYNYAYLSKIFSEINGINIERYIILQKIEKVKSMLIYDSAYLNEIAYKMNYSSVSHLSAQFKKITGIRVRDYKLLRSNAYISMPCMIAV